ncbi:hypothetical protein VTI74DRAFT_7059 [Chaetomium olivicolor]
METIIPSHDYEPSTNEPTWEEDNEVSPLTRALHSHSPSSSRSNPGRQPTQWPFQSSATDTDISSPTSSSSASYHQSCRAATRSQLIRYKPYRSPGSRTPKPEAASPIEQDIVPDYVVNFLRGETPESLSRRRRTQSICERTGTPQCGVVDLVPAFRNPQHQSQVARFEEFHFGDESVLELGRVESQEEGCEEERFLGSEQAEEGVREKAAGRKNGGSRRLVVGWRAAVAMNVLVMFLTLIVGFVSLVVAISGVSLPGAAIFVGSCAAARGVDLGLHAVTSVFAVVMVAGANYTFQVLSSPTREEVTAAHEKRDWLDIGVPSLRNLGKIKAGRAALAVLVLGTAVMSQVMCEAVIYVSQTAPELKAAVVGESFLRGAPFSDSSSHRSGLSRLDLLTLQQRAAHGELIHLSTPACINRFSRALEDEYSAVLLISNRENPLQTAEGLGTNVILDLASDQSSIQYCLAQPASASTCEVDLNPPLLGAVAFLNSIAFVATASVLFKRPSYFRPLATLGDAISSFLEDPDPTTQGACLLSKNEVLQGRWPLTQAKYWVPKNHYWVRSVSFPRWLITLFIWAASIGLVAALLSFSITSDPSAQLSPFGAPSPHVLIQLPSSTPAAAAAIITSLPQLLLALLYFAVNGVLTSYYLSHESSLFALAPVRPLRVSANASGAQTTSLHLTLPRSLSAILMVWFMGMSWLLSAGFIPVSIHTVDVPVSSSSLPSSFASISAKHIIGLSCSGAALLALLITLLVLAVAVFSLGLRRAPASGTVNGRMLGNPMTLPGGSCSAVISARCHPLAREKEGLWKKKVMWGVVREGVGFGQSHCAFTSPGRGAGSGGRGAVQELRVGRDYA